MHLLKKLSVTPPNPTAFGATRHNSGALLYIFAQVYTPLGHIATIAKRHWCVQSGACL